MNFIIKILEKNFGKDPNLITDLFIHDIIHDIENDIRYMEEHGIYDKKYVDSFKVYFKYGRINPEKFTVYIDYKEYKKLERKSKLDDIIR